MRKLLIAGCLFIFIIGGCATLAPHELPNQSRAGGAPAIPANISLTEMPALVPTSTVEIIENPPPCWAADLIYHTRIKKMILVNCVADPNKAALLTLWSWDGRQWQKLAEDGPLGRILGGVAYDHLRNALVLYGGRPVAMGECSQETWEWDGEFWEQKNAEPPTACDHVKMVYHAASQKSILFSGLDPSENLVNETWAWNGQNWKLLSEKGPESRGHFGLVYDPSHKQTLLYGGYASTVSDEFWIWKNKAWEGVDFPGPGALSHFGMTFDTDANTLYIFGGATSASTFSSLTDKTWVLSTGHWRELSPAIAPSARGGPAMGYDPVRKRLVLYGGFDSSQNNLNDTWEWDGKNWTCIMNCD